MIVKIIVLCMVGCLNWGNTTNLEEQPKKHLFVNGNSFQVNDFQEISGIIEENIKVVGIKPAKERDTFDTGISTATEGSVQQLCFGKKPKPI